MAKHQAYQKIRVYAWQCLIYNGTLESLTNSLCKQTKPLRITAFLVGITVLNQKIILQRQYQNRHFIPMLIESPCITYIRS